MQNLKVSALSLSYTSMLLTRVSYLHVVKPKKSVTQWDIKRVNSNCISPINTDTDHCLISTTFFLVLERFLSSANIIPQFLTYLSWTDENLWNTKTQMKLFFSIC